MKNKKRIITESERQADLIKRQGAIIESFGKEFNKIKRIDEIGIDYPVTEVNGLEVGMEVEFNVPSELNDNPEVTAVGEITGFDATTHEDYAMISYEGGDVSVPVGEVRPIQQAQQGVSEPEMGDGMMQEQDPVGDGFGAEYGNNEPHEDYDWNQIDSDTVEIDGERYDYYSRSGAALKYINQYGTKFALVKAKSKTQDPDYPDWEVLDVMLVGPYQDPDFGTFSTAN